MAFEVVEIRMIFGCRHSDFGSNVSTAYVQPQKQDKCVAGLVFSLRVSTSKYMYDAYRNGLESLMAIQLKLNISAW